MLKESISFRTSYFIHLSPDCVRFFGKDVLEISELKSNLIIGNLYNLRVAVNLNNLFKVM